MPQALEFIKRHPVAISVSAIAVVGLAAYATSGGGTGTDVVPAGSVTDPSQVAAGVEMARIQAGAAVASQEIEAQRVTEEGAQATALSIAELQKSFSELQLLTQKDIAIEGLNFEATKSALEAQIESENIAADLERERLQQSTIRHQNETLVDIVREQRKPRGLFSFIFG